LPFTGDTFTHLFSWDQDPQRQEKIVNSRLEAEFDGVDTGLSAAAARITVISPASGQIAFPATQNPSANPNTLDDYEEGTWTPACTFATPGDLVFTHSSQIGIYTKIGNIVTAHFTATSSTFTHSTASGNFQITGFPFAAAENSSQGQRCAGAQWQGITKANYTDMTASVEPSSTLATVRASGSGQTTATITAADMPTGGTVVMRGSATYLV
jgi:hypothetical protein